MQGRPLFIAVLGAAEVEEQLEPGHWGEISLFDPQVNYCIYLVGPELSQVITSMLLLQFCNFSLPIRRNTSSH